MADARTANLAVNFTRRPVNPIKRIRQFVQKNQGTGEQRLTRPQHNHTQHLLASSPVTESLRPSPFSEAHRVSIDGLSPMIHRIHRSTIRSLHLPLLLPSLATFCITTSLQQVPETFHSPPLMSVASFLFVCHPPQPLHHSRARGQRMVTTNSCAKHHEERSHHAKHNAH